VNIFYNLLYKCKHKVCIGYNRGKQIINIVVYLYKIMNEIGNSFETFIPWPACRKHAINRDEMNCNSQLLF